MIKIINLTPHPVTIYRSGYSSVTYPAPTRYRDNPTRVIESPSYPGDLDPFPMHLGFATIGIGDLALAAGASGAQDGQGAEQNVRSLQGSGIVDFLGYAGVEGLPEPSPYDRMFGFDTFWIVSIETALGAAAAGRGIEDLLIPTGRILDADGEIAGVAALSPATALLSPLYRRWTMPPAREADAREARRSPHDRGMLCARAADRPATSAPEMLRRPGDLSCTGCGSILLFSARERGDGLCGPCSRKKASDDQCPRAEMSPDDGSARIGAAPSALAKVSP